MSNMAVFWGLLIPFLGTTLGAGLVFLMKNKINKRKGGTNEKRFCGII
jgi:hypothetical protein